MVSGDEEFRVELRSIARPLIGRAMPVFDPRDGGYQRVISFRLRRLDGVCGRRSVAFIGYAAAELWRKFDRELVDGVMPATEAIAIVGLCRHSGFESDSGR